MAPPVFRIDQRGTEAHGRFADEILLNAVTLAGTDGLTAAIQDIVHTAGNARAQFLLRVVLRWQGEDGDIRLPDVASGAGRLTDVVTTGSSEAVREELDRLPGYPIPLIRLREGLRLGHGLEPHEHERFCKWVHATPEHPPDAAAVTDFLKGTRRTLTRYLDRDESPIRCVRLVETANWPATRTDPPRRARRFLAIVPAIVLTPADASPEPADQPAHEPTIRPPRRAGSLRPMGLLAATAIIAVGVLTWVLTTPSTRSVALGLGLLGSPEEETIDEVRAALSALDVKRALAASERDGSTAAPWGPLLRRWAGAKYVDPPQGAVLAARIPSIGQPFILSSMPRDDAHELMWYARPFDRTQPRWLGPTFARPLHHAFQVALDGDSIFVLAARDSAGTMLTHIVRLTLNGDPEVLAEPTSGTPAGVTAADLDEDGRDELVMAFRDGRREVVSYHWGETGLTGRRTAPALSTLNADLTGIASSLDGSVLVTASSWYGHGLFRIRDGQVVDRRRIGAVVGLQRTNDPNLFVTATGFLGDQAPSWPRHLGEPFRPGVQLWSDRDAGLTLTQNVPVCPEHIPDEDCGVFAPGVADLDGDGDDDVFLRVEDLRTSTLWVAVLLREGATLHAPVHIPGGLIAALPVPGETHVALVVRTDHRTLVLGDGHSPPNRVANRIPSAEPGTATDVHLPGIGEPVDLTNGPWRIDDPMAIHVDENGVHYHIEGPGHRIARLPLRVTDTAPAGEPSPLIVDATWTVDELRWSTSAGLRIVPRGTSQKNLELDLLGQGGGGQLFHTAGCYPSKSVQGTRIGGYRPVPSAIVAQEIRIRMAADPATASLTCAVWIDGKLRETAKLDYESALFGDLAGPLDLVVGDLGRSEGVGPSGAVVTLRRLALAGIKVDRDVPAVSRLQDLHWSWATGAPSASTVQDYREQVRSGEAGPLGELRLASLALDATEASDALGRWLDHHPVPTPWLPTSPADWTVAHELTRALALDDRLIELLAEHDRDAASGYLNARVQALLQDGNHQRAAVGDLVRRGAALKPGADAEALPHLVSVHAASHPQATRNDIADELGRFREDRWLNLPTAEQAQLHVLQCRSAADRGNDVETLKRATMAMGLSNNPIKTIDALMAQEAVCDVVRRNPTAWQPLLARAMWRPPMEAKVGEVVFPAGFGM